MLALFVAFTLDLSQPGWSVLTVYVVSQPSAGMVVAKATFRVVGTVIGALMAVTLVGAFSQVPALFLIGLALWIAGCVFVSVLLRDAPAAYGAMLAGYSAAIIGVPAVLAPDTAFDSAVARCLEISLGILCATLVSRLVLPRTTGESLTAAIDRCVAASCAWAGDVLNERIGGDKGLADRAEMLADVAALEQLRIFAAIDTPGARAVSAAVRQLQAQLLRLLANMVSVRDRLSVVKTYAPYLLDELRPLLQATDAVLRQQLTEPAEAAQALPRETQLRATIAAALPGMAELVSDRQRVLSRNVLLRLDDTLVTAAELARLRDAITAGRPWAGPPGEAEVARYRDYPLAGVAAAVAFIAVLTTSIFWVLTAWSNGSSALLFVGVITSIVASLDDPVASASSFLGMTVLAAVVAGVYLFWVFPGIDDFAGMAVSLMVFLVPLGAVLAVPGVGPRFVPLALNTVALIGFSNGMAQTDFATFANGALGLMGGIGVGILSLRLLRPVGVGWTIERMCLGLFADLGRQAGRGRPRPRTRFSGLVLDRINTLLPRLTPGDSGHSELIEGAMAGLRIGLNITELQLVKRSLPPALRLRVEAALDALAQHFRALAAGRPRMDAMAEVDAAIAALLADEAKRQERGDEPLTDALSQAAIMSLVSLTAIGGGLRRHRDVFAIALPGAASPAIVGAPA
ncbi:fusaric acid transporter [Chelatococcus reniformis]|uniref:Fusaric acid transporter n=2 Tax=Chelatococcus reniformis TaxID=1494448 RepID=A0A916U7J8_9HYPH|nr:fusaric acid transporter [Chelatococcus reniformis]